MTIQDLKDNNLILFECLCGSQSYNLATKDSDRDIRGVFYLPLHDFLGMKYVEQVSDERNDTVYYELGKFVELLSKSNPNALELLAMSDSSILYKHPLMNILEIKDFLSKECKQTFAGYAYSQIKKARGLNKKIVNPFPKERKILLDFCYIFQNNYSTPVMEWLESKGLKQESCGLTKVPHTKGVYALFYNHSGEHDYKGIIQKSFSNDISLSEVPKGEVALANMYFNIEHYSLFCKEYLEYWEWVEKRNQARYQSNISSGSEYDTKNMMHTIRLLKVALEIFEQEKINVFREDRNFLLEIKSGKYGFDEMIQYAEELMSKIEASAVASKLPEFVDKERVNELLVEIREALYFE